MNKKIIKEEESDIKNIFNRIKKRNFKGYTGLAVKNSIYQFATTGVSKIGALAFTVILARLLMPELFGLYSLALSTILLFGAFADLGVATALIKFVSEALGKNKKDKAKSYVSYLFKIKIFLVLITALILIISAKFISYDYYQKPLFLALIAGALYLISTSFVSFFEGFFYASNKFKYPFYRELFFQITRLILVPLIILISLRYSVSHQISIFLIISALAVSYLLTFCLVFFMVKRNVSFLNVKKGKITNREKGRIKNFILPLSAISLSGMFFGYIDMVMLGRFVLAEFLGHYKAAFSLITAVASLTFFSGVLFPIFSRLKGKRLEIAFKKSIRLTLILSFLAIIGTLIFAPFVVKIVFGEEYLNAVSILRIFTLLLISFPISAIYTSYFYSKGQTLLVSKLLIYSTIINILLNYLLITRLLSYSQFMAVIGASIATIISRYFYMGGLIFQKWRDKGN